MALTQFNEWQPGLDPVNGVMQQEPRVFAHDAASIVPGAINNSDANHGITITTRGVGFVIGETIDITNAAGTDAVITVRSIDDAGGVVSYDLTIAGDTYDVLYDAGTVIGPLSGSIAGTLFECIVSNIDIPETQKRGCCIYVGDVTTTGAELQVELESGNIVTFYGLTAGSFLPILAKRVTSGAGALTTAEQLLALY